MEHQLLQGKLCADSAYFVTLHKYNILEYDVILLMDSGQCTCYPCTH